MQQKKIYTIVDFPTIGKESGRYSGTSPQQAASKALTQLSRKVNLQNSNDKNFMVLTLRKLGTNKKYTYIGTRVKLYRPISRNINGKAVIFRYRNVITTHSNLL